jgi:hypothetical protein
VTICKWQLDEHKSKHPTKNGENLCKKGSIISPYSTYFWTKSKYDIYSVLCKPCRVRKAQNFIEPLKWLVYHQPNPVHINGPVNQGLFLSLKICLKKLKFYMYYLLQRKLSSILLTQHICNQTSTPIILVLMLCKLYG